MSSRRVRIWDVASLFTKDNLASVVTNAVVALDLKQEDDKQATLHVSHSEGESIFCTSCQVSIPDNSHYKTDWHVLNAKLRAVGAKPVSQNEFQHLELENELGDEEELIEERANQASASNNTTSLETQAQTGSARITFITKDNSTLAVWKSVLLPGKSGTIGEYAHAALSLSSPIDPSFPKALPSTAKGAVATSSSTPTLSPSAIASLPQHPFQWAVFLCQGGFFAGAVFRGDQVLKHKRIAKYTVRRKQGGSQASKDQSKGGIHSAGASIRRYNETRLREEIAETLKSWNVELVQSSRVFLHAPSFNSASFYYEGSPFSRRDPRIRSIPIVTERPSFVELQRIHLILSTVEIATFEGIDALRNSLEVPHPTASQSETSSIADLSEAASMRSSTSSFFSLTEGEHANWAHESSSHAEKSKKETIDLLAAAIDKNDESEARRLLTEEDYVYSIPDKAEDMVWPLMRAVQLGHVSLVKCLIECGESLDDRSPKYGLKTVLHIACEQSNNELVELFLEEGANPSILDLYSHTPFESCKEKSTRNLIRKFAGANPDLWQWETQARVPPLTDEMEEQAKAKEAEKRKRKKAAQKERKKVAKAEEEVAQAEQAEKAKADEELLLARTAAYERTKRMLNMSDREKRALAAERRLNPSANTCDNCGQKITGEPFERYSFKYCSSECVVEHKRILDTLQSSSSAK